MHASSRTCRRRGVTAVEFAIVAPAVFLLVFAQIIGGLAVFRYQEVAHLAREGARYASTHGGDYQREGVASRTGVRAIATSADLRQYLAGRVVSLNSNGLEVSVSWTAPSGIVPRNTPFYMDPNPNLVPPGQTVVQNNVVVTVRYRWFPEAYLVGPIVLSSTSQMPMSY
jgi:Flp pilus assembly protein TadG